MADFSENVLKEILKATKESNKKLGILERQGEEDDTPRSIIAQAVPEVLAQHRYPRVFQEKQGLYDVDDLMVKLIDNSKEANQSIVRALDSLKSAAKEQVLLITDQSNNSQKGFSKLLTGFKDGLYKFVAAPGREAAKFNEKRREKEYKDTLLQTESLQKMKENLERFGGVATDNKKYNKASLQLQKDQLKLRLRQPDLTPAKRKEIKREMAELDKKKAKTQNIMMRALSGMWGATKDAGKKIGGGIWVFLKGLAFAGALLLLLKFLDSDMWQKW